MKERRRRNGNGNNYNDQQQHDFYCSKRKLKTHIERLKKSLPNGDKAIEFLLYLQASGMSTIRVVRNSMCLVKMLPVLDVQTARLQAHCATLSLATGTPIWSRESQDHTRRRFNTVVGVDLDSLSAKECHDLFYENPANWLKDRDVLRAVEALDSASDNPGRVADDVLKLAQKGRIPVMPFEKGKIAWSEGRRSHDTIHTNRDESNRKSNRDRSCQS
jgi:hypothetical protein